MKKAREDAAAHMEAGIQAIADNLDEGLVVIQKGRIVFMNDKLSEVTGASPESLRNASLNDLISHAFPESTKYVELQYRRESGESVEYPSELQFVTESGRVIEMRNRSSVISWRGQPATLHFLEDITRRKEIERLLTQQTAMNEIITDSVGRILASPLSLDEIAGTVMDSAMELTDSRTGILKIDGSDGNKVLHRRCTDPCPNCRLLDILHKVTGDDELMSRTRPGRFEGSFYLNEKISVKPQNVDKADLENILRVPVENAGSLSGQIVLAGALGPYGPWDLDAMEKIAEVLSLALVRYQAVEELRRAKETAEREAQSRSQFMANVTHEVRSPLNGVLMMASLLQETELDTDQKELLGVVTFSARTIDRLIRDLTDINQIRAGKFRVYNTEFNLGELCRHIIEIQKTEARGRDLELEYSVYPGASRFYGDRERTGQILVNLLANAVRYTDEGKVRLDVVVEGGELLMTVADTGPGISVEDQQKVFEMFRQLDSNSRQQGSGIGLAVVKELVDAMDGRISLASTPGKGSTFSVYLPITSPSDREKPGDTVQERSESGESPRILIAEDEGGNRLYLRNLLENLGCIVDEAVNGEEAVEKAGSREYRLIIMDINMPFMDGLEAATRIRETGNSVPIVAVTAQAPRDDRNHLLRSGLDDIVRKPLEGSKLTECLNRYIRS